MKAIVVACAVFVALCALVMVGIVHDYHAGRACVRAGHTWLDAPVNRCVNAPPVKE